MKVYTGATFDLFHSGHVRFLERCATFGPVTVALNTDEFIEDFKGAPPIMTLDERRIVVAACRYVDEVVVNIGGHDSRPSIELVKPDIIIVGSDWLKKDYKAQMMFTTAWLEERGIGLCYIPYTHGISSTELKRRLSQGL